MNMLRFTRYLPMLLLTLVPFLCSPTTFAHTVPRRRARSPNMHYPAGPNPRVSRKALMATSGSLITVETRLGGSHHRAYHGISCQACCPSDITTGPGGDLWYSVGQVKQVRMQLHWEEYDSRVNPPYTLLFSQIVMFPLASRKALMAICGSRSTVQFTRSGRRPYWEDDAPGQRYIYRSRGISRSGRYYKWTGWQSLVHRVGSSFTDHRPAQPIYAQNDQLPFLHGTH